MQPRLILGVLIVVGASFFTRVHNIQADEPSVAATATAAAKTAQIEVWVKQLDSDVYAERQAAMLSLKQSGVAGVAALANVARMSNPEVTARAIALLAQMYQSPETEVAFAADDVLESLGKEGPPVAVVRTQEVLTTTLQRLRRQHAITAIKRLGGHVIPETTGDDDEANDVEADPNDATVQNVVLGKSWKGGVAGIKYIQRLPELKLLSITTSVSLNEIEQNQVKSMLPGLRIETRGSTYLGVRSWTQDPELCIIDSVVPNSPAKRGGIRPGDLITHVDGLRIHGFLTLTAALALKQGGEAVYLEVQRDDQFLELAVTLGEW